MPDPNEKVTYPERGAYGQTLYMGRRTAAHLDWTKAELAKKHPAARLVVIQGAYNVGVSASAGTHDLDSALDVQIVGLGWLDAQRFLRECGWAAWYRYPPTFSEHIHMISLGCTGPVGIYVPGQIADYYAHRSGLAGHAADDSWHPDHIDSTIFDYPGWVVAQEDIVQKQDIDTITAAVRTIVAEEIAKAADTIKVDVGDGKPKLSLGTILRSTWKRSKA